MRFVKPLRQIILRKSATQMHLRTSLAQPFETSFRKQRPQIGLGYEQIRRAHPAQHRVMQDPQKNCGTGALQGHVESRQTQRFYQSLHYVWCEL